MKISIQKTSRKGVDLRLSEDYYHDIYTSAKIDAVKPVKILLRDSIILFNPHNLTDDFVLIDADKFDWHTPLCPAIFVRDVDDTYYQIDLCK